MASMLEVVTRTSSVSEGKEYLGKVVWAFLIGSVLLSILPKSPFQYFYDSLGSVNELVNLSFVNWFVPFGTFIAIGQAWLIAITVFYGIQYALRIVNIIGG